ncbi:MAG: hypothetical protein BRD30_11710 [Bacteroidetes bacterium QH_2_63_10]|nr:MAG: hypothetical protein BRD30_11710 [Bacteroidetes bacterium QH_2_63_10]
MTLPTMIRKRISITEAQEEALTARARELGISEAELMRRALDAFLTASSVESSQRRSALDRLLAHTHDLARRHRLPATGKWTREELYADRPRHVTSCSS